MPQVSIEPLGIDWSVSAMGVAVPEAGAAAVVGVGDIATDGAEEGSTAVELEPSCMDEPAAITTLVTSSFSKGTGMKFEKDGGPE